MDIYIWPGLPLALCWSSTRGLLGRRIFCIGCLLSAHRLVAEGAGETVRSLVGRSHYSGGGAMQGGYTSSAKEFWPRRPLSRGRPTGMGQSVYMHIQSYVCPNRYQPPRIGWPPYSNRLVLCFPSSPLLSSHYSRAPSQWQHRSGVT